MPENRWFSFLNKQKKDPFLELQQRQALTPQTQPEALISQAQKPQVMLPEVQPEAKRIYFPQPFGSYMLKPNAYESTTINNIVALTLERIQKLTGIQARLGAFGRTGLQQTDVSEAIAQVVSEQLPYDELLEVQADEQTRFTKLLEVGGGVCRHNVSVSTSVAQIIGLPVRPFVFGFRDDQGKLHGHTATISTIGSHGFVYPPDDALTYQIIDGSEGRSYDFREYLDLYGGVMESAYYLRSTYQYDTNTWNKFDVDYFRRTQKLTDPSV